MTTTIDSELVADLLKTAQAKQTEFYSALGALEAALGNAVVIDPEADLDTYTADSLITEFGVLTYDICECGRYTQECTTYDDPEAGHYNR